MKKFKIFYLNEKYYDYLFNIKNLDQTLSKKLRPHINLVGVKLPGGVDYLIPLSTDHSNKYKPSHKYTFVIPAKGNQKMNILLKINKMIPVIKHKAFMCKPNINKIVNDHGPNNQILESLEFLNKPENQKLIYQLAEEVYEKRWSASKKQLDPNSNQSDWNLITAVDFEKAEIAMMEYAFEQKIDQPYIFEHLIQEQWRFSELNEYCQKNNIEQKDIFSLGDSQFFELCLIKFPNGKIELVHEIWSDENDIDEYKVFPPYIFEKEEVTTTKEVIQLLKDWDFYDSVFETMESSEKKETFDDIKKFLNEPSQNRKRTISQ